MRPRSAQKLPSSDFQQFPTARTRPAALALGDQHVTLPGSMPPMPRNQPRTAGETRTRQSLKHVAGWIALVSGQMIQTRLT